ncbi:MAG TPA: GNAT family N-acetyltransferase [Streptosporangiaceae bacterium]|nr:GNAT family N-acetyltransferase [Streptosporangiaceae bacterium]
MTRLDRQLAVRSARPGDEAGLARLDAAAWTPASGFPSVTERASDPFFTFFTASGPPGEYLVAELDGRLAGYVRLRPVTELRENAHVLGIMGLAVAPDARRQGVASALLAAAERHARARGARKLSLHVLGTNAAAERLYERLGFVREGTLRDEFRIGGQYVDDVIMAKHLA